MLVIAGCLSAGIAILHVVIVFVGPPAYAYFGAGDWMVAQAEAGSSMPATMALFIAAIFAIFALYGFSGAARIPRLPFQRSVLLAIGLLYTVRGLAVFMESVRGGTGPQRFLIFSLVSLLIGLLYLFGVRQQWGVLSPGKGTVEGSATNDAV